MNSLIVFQQMLVLFAMILAGYFCYKKDIITDELQPKLSYMVVNVFNPFLVISSITDKSVDKSMELILENICLVIILFAVWMITGPIIVRLLRIPGKKRPLYSLMNIFSNLGFMGLPLISAIYGKGAVIYVSFYMLMYNLLLYTYGIYVAGKHPLSKKADFSWKKIMNPGFISCLVAIIIFALQIPVPQAAATLVSYMGNTAVPLSTILSGVFMAKINSKEIFTNIKIYLFSLIKLGILPILLIQILKLLPFDSTLLGIFLLLSGTPVGSIVILVADEYGIGGKEGVQGIVLTTLLSLFTLPFIALFY